MDRANASRFDLYFEAIKVKTDRRQIVLLLHIGGDKIEKIYEAKRDSSKARKDEKYADISKLLTDHFAPQKNTNVSILTFRQASQRQAEGIDAFVVCLKTLASACGFGTDAETKVKLQVMQGCLDKRVKIKASQEDTISFAGLIKFAQALEFSAEALSGPWFKKEPGAAKIESACLLGDFYRGSKHHRLNNFQGGGKPSKNGGDTRRTENKKESTCFKCGCEYPHKGECPAKGKACSKCGQMNHFARKFSNSKNEKKSDQSQYKWKTFQIAQAEENRKVKFDHGMFCVFTAKTTNAKCPRITVSIRNLKPTS